MSEPAVATLEKTSWWGRPMGGHDELRIALPLVISSVSWTVMTFVDRMFLKWTSGEAMSAAFFAATVWFASLCVPLGICTYVSTFVAQYHGDGQFKRIGPVMWQGVWIALLAGPILLLAAPLIVQVFHVADHGVGVQQKETLYFYILTVGTPAMLLAQSFSSFYSGRGQTVVVMWTDMIFVVLNVLLDYLWIFGHAGFPAMGIAGAGWATVVALWLKALTYLLLVLQKKHRFQFHTVLGMCWDFRLVRRLVYFGGPSGVQLLLDVMGFSIFVLLVHRIGSLEAEATTMAFSINTLAFMPIWGVALATGILVGQRLGEDRDDLAARATWTALWIALGYMVLISILYVVVPEFFLFGFFVADVDPTGQQLAIKSMAANLLMFVAAYNLFDAAAMIFASTVKGAGDTRFILKLSLVMAAMLVLVTWLGVEVWKLSIYGCWALFTTWIWVLGLAFLLRFLQGKWRKIRVIEVRARESPAPASPTPGPIRS